MHGTRTVVALLVRGRLLCRTGTVNAHMVGMPGAHFAHFVCAQTAVKNCERHGWWGSVSVLKRPLTDAEGELVQPHPPRKEIKCLATASDSRGVAGAGTGSRIAEPVERASEVVGTPAAPSSSVTHIVRATAAMSVYMVYIDRMLPLMWGAQTRSVTAHVGRRPDRLPLMWGADPIDYRSCGAQTRRSKKKKGKKKKGKKKKVEYSVFLCSRLLAAPWDG